MQAAADGGGFFNNSSPAPSGSGGVGARAGVYEREGEDISTDFRRRLGSLVMVDEVESTGVLGQYAFVSFDIGDLFIGFFLSLSFLGQSDQYSCS